MRVLLAAMLLEDPARTVTGVAQACGYAGDHSLRRAVRELTGGDGAALPRRDALTRATEAFNAELRGLREELRGRRRAAAAGGAGLPS